MRDTEKCSRGVRIKGSFEEKKVCTREITVIHSWGQKDSDSAYFMQKGQSTVFYQIVSNTRQLLKEKTAKA